MNIVLVGKRKILFEKNKNANDLIVMYVPMEDGMQLFHDLQGNKTDYEVASRAGSPEKKPVWRDIGGKIQLYGWVPEDLVNRTASARIWLPQDFAPEGTTIFYYALSDKHLVHGRKEIDDEQKSSWRVTTLQTASVEELVSLIKSSLVDQLMTGENQVPCIAVYQDPALQTKIDDELKYLQVTSQPLEKLSPAFKQIRPLYKQRNHTLLLMVGMLFFFLVLAACSFYWILGIIEVKRLNQQIIEVNTAIQNIQINERIGYIKAPEEIQAKINSKFKQLPSAMVDAPLRVAAQFGSLAKMRFKIESTEGNTFSVGTANTPGVYTFNIDTADTTRPMLVDQEILAQQIVAQTPWLRRISNMGTPNRTGISLVMEVQVEETPEMQNNAAQNPAPAPDVAPVTEVLPVAQTVSDTSATVAPAVSATDVPVSATAAPVVAPVAPAVSSTDVSGATS